MHFGLGIMVDSRPFEFDLKSSYGLHVEILSLQKKQTKVIIEALKLSNEGREVMGGHS
jgi:hypothetical protein